MKVRQIKARIFKEGEDLAAFIQKHIPKLKEGTVLAIASKIVALSERRVVRVSNKKTKEALIRAESEWQEKVLPDWWLTVRDSAVVVNAGIDESNADGNSILLPKDSFAAAADLHKKLKKAYRVKQLGIVITDSRVAPLRAGVTGVALGYAGFKGVRDYRGKKDIFGRRMNVTQTNVADSLATAATLVMGEGNERQPLCVIQGAPVVFSERVNRNEVSIPPKSDMYRSLFKGTKKR